MKKTLAIMTALTFGGAALTTTNVFAASEDECAIWICLPGGFPSGCSAAYSAMKKRVRDLKPPLPSLGSCMVDSGSVVSASSNHGRAAYIRRNDSWVRDTTCRRHRGSTFPNNCTKSGYYAEVFVDGVRQGDTYFFTP